VARQTMTGLGRMAFAASSETDDIALAGCLAGPPGLASAHVAKRTRSAI
jgi:hypothetical protein